MEIISKNYTGEQFRQLMMDEKTNEFVKKYYDEAYQGTGQNLRLQLEEDRKNGRPEFRGMLPMNFYSTTSQMAMSLNRPEDYPYYIIRGAVNLSSATLTWGLIFKRCIFTDKVTLSELTCSPGISFDHCIFEKDIVIDRLVTDALSIRETVDSIELKITNSTLGSLNLSGKTIIPYITDTTVKRLDIRY